MPTCLVDLRCLQDPSFSERGIGRHARALLARARAGLAGRRLVGIIDPQLPPLSAVERAMVDAVRTTAYTGAMTDPCCFVQLSAMTHDPLFVARLLEHRAIPAATVVYDFIPYDEPARYLNSPDARMDYHVALRWLARHELFLPISIDAADGLRRILGVPDSRIVVTGAPLAPAFEALHAGSPRHVLVVGGSDDRKNPECAIRAHAKTAAMQSARMPLVVTGVYSQGWVDAQRAGIAAAGGDASLLKTPGHVDEARLLAFYADAVCVVVPSRAEGFSLPVVEAMAAGTPVLASDIRVHRELLDDGLFGPDDDGRLASLLDQAMQPAWRNAALHRQALVWPRFRADAVAHRFWSAIGRLAPEAAPATTPRRPRVAFLTPLPPDRSGVADYSAITCAELGKLVDLHVFTPTTDPVTPAGAASVSPLSALPMLSSRFDRIVGVLGNSVYHLDILHLVLRYGGAVLLHDGRMLDLYAGNLGIERTERLAEAELDRKLLPNELQEWLAGDKPPAALILAEITEAAEPLLMHSSAGIAEVRARYGTTATHLPFSLYRTIPEQDLCSQARRLSRDRLKVGAGDVLIASFGYVHPSKAPIDCLWTLILLRSWGIEARLHFVGAPIMRLDEVHALIAEYELGHHVRLSADFVDEQTYRDHLVGADLGLQLRRSGAGSVSGALADCIAAGLRTVASATLAKAIDAPAYIRPIPDNPSPVLAAEAAARLLRLPDTAASRRDYVASHGFHAYAGQLCDALRLG